LGERPRHTYTACLIAAPLHVLRRLGLPRPVHEFQLTAAQASDVGYRRAQSLEKLTENAEVIGDLRHQLSGAMKIVAERAGQAVSSQSRNLLRRQRQQEALGFESRRPQNTAGHGCRFCDRGTQRRKPAPKRQAIAVRLSAGKPEPSLKLRNALPRHAVADTRLVTSVGES
jgi:hypothetical protein